MFEFPPKPPVEHSTELSDSEAELCLLFRYMQLQQDLNAWRKSSNNPFVHKFCRLALDFHH